MKKGNDPHRVRSRENRTLHSEAANAALTAFSSDATKSKLEKAPTPSYFDVERLNEVARAEVLRMYEAEGLWDEDVECLNAAVTTFV